MPPEENDVTYGFKFLNFQLANFIGYFFGEKKSGPYLDSFRVKILLKGVEVGPIFGKFAQKRVFGPNLGRDQNFEQNFALCTGSRALALVRKNPASVARVGLEIIGC